MLRTFLLFALALSHNFCLGQAKLSGPFQLKGNVSSIQRAHLVILRYYSVKDTLLITDTTLVENGHFTFKGTLAEPTLATIYVRVNLPNGKPDQRATWNHTSDVFLEPAIMSIVSRDTLVEGGHMSAWRISGSQVQRQFEELTALSDAYEKKFIQPAIERYDKIDMDKKAEQQRVNAEVEQLRADLPEKVYKPYFLSHLKDYISLHVLKEYCSNGIDPAKAGPLYAKLAPVYQDLPSGKGLKKRIVNAKATGIGQLAPGFVQPDTTGKPVSLASFRGKYVLLNFWASWWSPYRAENPVMLKAYQTYKDRNFTILGISLDDDKKRWLSAIRKDKLPWTQVVDLNKIKEVDLLYDVLSNLPKNYLLDPEGKIIARNLRGEALEKKLAEVLKK